jgi:hypothetical protein
MKTHAWMLSICCLSLLVPLSTARAEEQPQGFVKITVGIEGEGLERIPVVGSLLKYLAEAQKQECAEQEQEQVKLPPPPTECPKCANHERGVPITDKLPYVSRVFKNVGSAPRGENCETVEGNCPTSDCPAVAATERAVPILSQLPYVGQLFKEVVVGAVEEEFEVPVAKHPVPKAVRWVGPDGLERIGIDFDCEVMEQCAQCEAKRCAVTNAARATAVCPAPPANCPPVAVCPPPFAGFCEVVPAPPTIMHAQPVADRDELIQALMEARVEAAVAQTALKVREESDAKQLELIKELVTSQVENAKLTAKLELAAEKEKVLAQLLETHIELATLKAQVANESQVARRKPVPNGVEARQPSPSEDALR